MNQTYKSPTPGRVLYLTHLEPHGITIEAFAQSAGFTLTEAKSLLEEGAVITPEAARRIGAYLGTSAELWLDMQQKYEARDARARQPR